MRTSRIAIALLLCLGFVSRRAAAQAVIQPGETVRITAPCPATAPGKAARPPCRTRGELLSLGQDSISIGTYESTATYALGAVDRIELRAGARRHVLAGAGLGFLAGSGVTYLALHTGGSTSPCDPSRNQDAMQSGECLAVAALGGLAGALLGGVVGAFVRTDAWREIPLERLRVGWLPHRGMTVALRSF